jgi:hypothetical protein
MLGLGSGPTAKRAYAELTGRDPEATETTTRAKKGSGVVDTVSALQIYWDDDDDEIEIRTAISHRTIVVERSIGKDYLWYEEIQVAEVRGFIYNQLDIKTGEREPCDMAVEFTQRDTGGYRCVKVKWIREVH